MTIFQKKFGTSQDFHKSAVKLLFMCLTYKMLFTIHGWLYQNKFIYFENILL